jgi:hypothetical protein
MCPTPATTAPHGPSALERSIAFALTVIAVIGIALTLLAGVFMIGLNAAGRTVTVPLVPDTRRQPDLGVSPDVVWTMYDAVRIVALDPPLASRLLRIAGFCMYGLLIVSACVIAILLCRRLLSGRPFSRGAAPAIGGLGLLCIVAAAVAPALLLEGDYLAVADLGLRMFDPGTTSYLDAGAPADAEALWPERFDRLAVVLTRTNWLLAGIGGILLVVAVAFRRGLALQREADTLV